MRISARHRTIFPWARPGSRAHSRRAGDPERRAATTLRRHPIQAKITFARTHGEAPLHQIIVNNQATDRRAHFKLIKPPARQNQRTTRPTRNGERTKCQSQDFRANS